MGAPVKHSSRSFVFFRRNCKDEENRKEVDKKDRFSRSVADNRREIFFEVNHQLIDGILESLPYVKGKSRPF